jgi:NAD(P)-dependent dehydrogenase (short-subunit alcohol dehydrogenase family)
LNLQILSLEGKVAVVTGGTSGIGRALSLGLAEAGADVIATARRQQQVDETAHEIEARGRETLRLSSDVCDRASLDKLLAATLEKFGKVDILINCAGKIKRTPTLSVSEEEWDDILNTNLTGTLRACQVSARPCSTGATAASSISPHSTPLLPSPKWPPTPPARPRLPR